MIIYSVTVKVDLDVQEEWLSWMKNEHIAEVLQTGKFVSYKFHRVLAENETDGITYNVLYYAHSMSDYFDYKEDFAPALQEKALLKFPNKFVAFRTLLKEVE